MRTNARVKADKSYYERKKEAGISTTSFRVTKDEAVKLREFLKKLREAPSK